jgi:hypothetical protein
VLWKRSYPLLANFGLLNTKMALKFVDWLSFSNYSLGLKLQVFSHYWLHLSIRVGHHCSIVASQFYHVISHWHRLLLHHFIGSCCLERAFSFYVVFSELGQVVLICSRNELFEITVFFISSFLSCNIKTL